MKFYVRIFRCEQRPELRCECEYFIITPITGDNLFLFKFWRGKLMVSSLILADVLCGALTLRNGPHQIKRKKLIKSLNIMRVNGRGYYCASFNSCIQLWPSQLYCVMCAIIAYISLVAALLRLWCFS